MRRLSRSATTSAASSTLVSSLSAPPRHSASKRKRGHYRDIPNSIDKLVDESYRSLVDEFRHVGGCQEYHCFRRVFVANFPGCHVGGKEIELIFERTLKHSAEAGEAARRQSPPRVVRPNHWLDACYISLRALSDLYWLAASS